MGGRNAQPSHPSCKVASWRIRVLIGIIMHAHKVARHQWSKGSQSLPRNMPRTTRKTTRPKAKAPQKKLTTNATKGKKSLAALRVESPEDDSSHCGSSLRQKKDQCNKHWMAREIVENSPIDNRWHSGHC